MNVNNFSVTGIYKGAGSLQQITDTFGKRIFGLETTDQYDNIFHFNLIKTANRDNSTLVDEFKAGDEIKVSFNIRCTKSEKDGRTFRFTELNAWRIEKVSQQPQPTQEQPTPTTTLEETVDVNNDLPF